MALALTAFTLISGTCFAGFWDTVTKVAQQAQEVIQQSEKPSSYAQTGLTWLDRLHQAAQVATRQQPGQKANVLEQLYTAAEALSEATPESEKPAWLNKLEAAYAAWQRQPANVKAQEEADNPQVIAHIQKLIAENEARQQQKQAAAR